MAAVAVVNDHFTPAAVTVQAGESVSWNFNESGHNLDLEGATPTPKQAAGTVYTVAFPHAGTFAFRCDFHNMTGTVTVVAPPPTSAPPVQPPTSPPVQTTSPAQQTTSAPVVAGVGPYHWRRWVCWRGARRWHGRMQP